MEQGHGWAWSCAPDEPRSRRSTDGALLVGATVLLSLVLAARPGSGPTGRAIESFLRSLSFLRHLWLGFIVIGAASAALVVLWTVASRRFRLLRDIAVAAFAAWLLMLIVHHVFKTPPSARAAGLFEPEAEAWPVVRLTLAATVLCVAAPYLVRPLKYWQRVVLLAMSLGSIARGGTNVNGVLVALCVAWVAAAAVHLVFGSPGGRPALSRMSADLAALGFASTDVRAAPSGSDGVPMFTAISSGTPLAIKVFGMPGTVNCSQRHGAS